MVLLGRVGANDPADKLVPSLVANAFPKPEADVLATTSAAIYEMSSWDKVLDEVEAVNIETSPEEVNDTTIVGDLV